MKKWFYLSALILLISTLPSCAQTESPSQKQLTWYTSLAEAQKISNEKHKPIFAFFTGSDWCGWCHKLQNEVFDKPAFIDWAKKNVVLLELDFPRRKQLSPEMQQQNGELQQVFKVSGYPTVWVFNLTDDAATKKKNISAFGSCGYPQGAESGREEVKFLKDINAVLANKPQ